MLFKKLAMQSMTTLYPPPPPRDLRRPSPRWIAPPRKKKIV